MLKYIISTIFIVYFFNGFAQKELKTENSKDTISYKTGYGLRVGVDISKPILSIFDKSYKGLEIVGDYRVSKKWYIATELGYEKEITFEEFSTSTSSGNYLKLGVNYNTHKNWLDMNNEIYVGGRYGLSIFEQTLNSYTPNVNTTYFPSENNIVNINSGILTGHWLEFQLGIKVETFKNLFFGFHGAYKVGISIEDQENFDTFYAPGFNRVYASNSGFGFNYTISYLIPFIKK